MVRYGRVHTHRSTCAFTFPRSSTFLHVFYSWVKVSSMAIFFSQLPGITVYLVFWYIACTFSDGLEADFPPTGGGAHTKKMAWEISSKSFTDRTNRRSLLDDLGVSVRDICMVYLQ